MCWGTHQKHFSEALLMSKHNLFLQRNKKISFLLVEKKCRISSYGMILKTEKENSVKPGEKIFASFNVIINYFLIRKICRHQSQWLSF